MKKLVCETCHLYDKENCFCNYCNCHITDVPDVILTECEEQSTRD